MTLLLLTALVDLLAVGALLWVLRRAERHGVRIVAEQGEGLERLRGAVARLVADAERRTGDLTVALEAREATLRVLLAATHGAMPEAQPDRGARWASPIPADPAEIRLVRDLDLVLGSSAPRAAQEHV